MLRFHPFLVILWAPRHFRLIWPFILSTKPLWSSKPQLPHFTRCDTTASLITRVVAGWYVMPLQVLLVLDSFGSVAYELGPCPLALDPVKHCRTVNPTVIFFNALIFQDFLHMVHQFAQGMCCNKFQAGNCLVSWCYPRLSHKQSLLHWCRGVNC